MCDIMTHERRRVKNESLDNLSARRAKSVSEPAAFVLVNKRIEGALWKNQRFLELPMQAKLVDVQASNGLEQVNGKPFVWLRNNATRFLIVSKNAQTATLRPRNVYLTN